MRRIFQKWLFLFVAIAFLFTLAVTFTVQTYQAKENAVSLITLRIEDAEKQIETNNNNLETIKAMNASEALAKVRALAQLVYDNPAYLTNLKLLDGLRTTLDVDEIYIVDMRGVIIATTNSEYLNYNMYDGKQSAEFMGLANGTLSELVQKPQPMGANLSRIMQYAGVPRYDENHQIIGLLQIGYYPERLQKAMELADIESLAEGFRIGTNGMVLVSKDGSIVSSEGDLLGKKASSLSLTDELLKKKGFNVTINGTKYIGTLGKIRRIRDRRPFAGYRNVPQPQLFAPIAVYRQSASFCRGFYSDLIAGQPGGDFRYPPRKLRPSKDHGR